MKTTFCFMDITLLVGLMCLVSLSTGSQNGSPLDTKPFGSRLDYRIPNQALPLPTKIPTQKPRSQTPDITVREYEVLKLFILQSTNNNKPLRQSSATRRHTSDREETSENTVTEVFALVKDEAGTKKMVELHLMPRYLTDPPQNAIFTLSNRDKPSANYEDEYHSPTYDYPDLEEENHLSNENTNKKPPGKHIPPTMLNFEEEFDELSDLIENVPGIPGVDYPIMSVIPDTGFICEEQRYKGFFADTRTRCQVWHYCDFTDGHSSFLCPNGTVFNQVMLTCDWWFNVDCHLAPQQYVLNERLYKYIKPLTPKFPEDFHGPLVDKYLAITYAMEQAKKAAQKVKTKFKRH